MHLLGLMLICLSLYAPLGAQEALVQPLQLHDPIDREGFLVPERSDADREGPDFTETDAGNHEEELDSPDSPLLITPLQGESFLHRGRRRAQLLGNQTQPLPLKSRLYTTSQAYLAFGAPERFSIVIHPKTALRSTWMDPNWRLTLTGHEGVLHVSCLGQAPRLRWTPPGDEIWRQLRLTPSPEADFILVSRAGELMVWQLRGSLRLSVPTAVLRTLRPSGPLAELQDAQVRPRRDGRTQMDLFPGQALRLTETVSQLALVISLPDPTIFGPLILRSAPQLARTDDETPEPLRTAALNWRTRILEERNQDEVASAASVQKLVRQLRFEEALQLLDRMPESEKAGLGPRWSVWDRILRLYLLQRPPRLSNQEIAAMAPDIRSELRRAYLSYVLRLPPEERPRLWNQLVENPLSLIGLDLSLTTEPEPNPPHVSHFSPRLFPIRLEPHYSFPTAEIRPGVDPDRYLLGVHSQTAEEYRTADDLWRGAADNRLIGVSQSRWQAELWQSKPQTVTIAATLGHDNDVLRRGEPAPPSIGHRSSGFGELHGRLERILDRGAHHQISLVLEGSFGFYSYANLADVAPFRVSLALPWTLAFDTSLVTVAPQFESRAIGERLDLYTYKVELLRPTVTQPWRWSFEQGQAFDPNPGVERWLDPLTGEPTQWADHGLRLLRTRGEWLPRRAGPWWGRMGLIAERFDYRSMAKDAEDRTVLTGLGKVQYAWTPIWRLEFDFAWGQHRLKQSTQQMAQLQKISLIRTEGLRWEHEIFGTRQVTPSFLKASEIQSLQWGVSTRYAW